MNEKDLNELITMVRLSDDPSKPLHVISRESARLEFKESYHHLSLPSYAKTMAAFANTKGGWLIFGIKDKPYRQIIGLVDEKFEKFNALSVEGFTQFLKDYFAPEISWYHRSFKIAEHNLGAIKVDELKRKPCICLKVSTDNKDKSKKPLLSEGDIYYRYSGQTSRIQYSELRSIIDAEVERNNLAWKEIFKSLGKIDVDNVKLLDLGNGEITGIGQSLFIDEKLLKDMRFIQEGTFTEKNGSPALRITGEIKNVMPIEMSIKPKTVAISISQIEIIRVFLTQQEVFAPEEYIKQIVAERTIYLPIYYFMDLKDISTEETISLIEELPQQRYLKDKIINRLKSQRIAEENIPHSRQHPSTLQTMRFYDSLKNRTFDIGEASQNCGKVCKAFLYLTEQEIKNAKEYYLETLLKLFDCFFSDANSADISLLRKVICRLDEVLYFYRD